MLVHTPPGVWTSYFFGARVGTPHSSIATLRFVPAPITFRHIQM
jgi:hypothetical protein